MIRPQLQLQFRVTSRRPAAAVLLRGDDARQWIETLLQANVPLETLRLLPLPADDAVQISGALCPVSAAEAEHFGPDVTRYGVIAGRLFVPREAVVEPPVAEDEWDVLLPDDGSRWVWHPRHQLIRFEPSQQLGVADLLERPVQRASDWDRACDGTAEPPRLLSLRVDGLPSLEQVLKDSQDGIGSDADERFLTPPNEPEASEFSAGQRLLASGFDSLASLAGWIRAQVPGSPDGTDFYDRAIRWLSQMAQLTPRIEREREREIQRLLDKLATDPDEGLKFALPMGGRPGRGLASPGDRLTRRNVDFRPGAGGGPVDPWSISYELQLKLQQQYRAACEREIRLGRFRRAAYIYAELLGDYHAAAQALESGRHYRDAAAVYRDELNRPLDAARCLERGGLLPEAIEIFAQHGHYETVGSLYERLQDPESAHAAYRQAADDYLQAGDRLQAARILRSHVHDTEEALAVLWESWPDCSQTDQCLRDYFTALGETGEHRRARQSIDELGADDLSLRSREKLVRILSSLSGQYPDAVVADQAADAARQAASLHIQASQTASTVVMKALAELAPEDRLLARDCRRFRDEKLALPTVAKRRPTRRGARRGRLVRQIALPPGFRWITAESVNPHVYLVGHDGHQTLLLLRVNLTAESNDWSSQVVWTGPENSGEDVPVLLGFNRTEDGSIRIARIGCPPLPPRMLPSADDHPRTMVASTPGWLSDEHIGFKSTGLYHWTLDTGFLLSQHSAGGLLQRSIQLDHFEPAEDSPRQQITVPVPIHTRPESVCVGLGSCCWRVPTRQRPQQLVQFSGCITAIKGSVLHTRERILVIHENGASMLFPTLEDAGEIVLEEQHADLSGTMLGNGQAVLWSPAAGGLGELRLYSTTHGHCELLGVTAMAGNAEPLPLDLLSTSSPDECAVIPREPGVPIAVWDFGSSD